MRAREFIVENYSTDLPVQEIKQILSVIKDEAEEVNDATMAYHDANDPKYKALEKDYHALTAISYVLNNNIKAHKLAQENPAVFDTNIFMYDVEPEDILDSGIAAIHISLHDNVAEIKWLGSYGAPGGKLMQSALNLAKSRGATNVKVDAKWNSEGFYRKMGLDQDTAAGPDRSEVFRGSKLTPFTGVLEEGGWDTTLTQGTVLTPATVERALKIVDQFVIDFNKWLSSRGVDPIKRGNPTGSSSYYKKDMVDNPSKIYGDIDLQIIAAPVEGLTHGQFTNHWNAVLDDFIQSARPPYIAIGESKSGHPIFQIGPDQYVQIDFMWHTPALSKWGAARVTPEHGTKGMLMGNLFSVLGSLLEMSIQHAGVQYKTIDGKPVPYAKRKDTELNTLSINPTRFVYDILKNLHSRTVPDQPLQIAPLLKANPGIDPKNVQIQTMVNAIKGLAQSFEMNRMYGKDVLEPYTDAADFLNKFVGLYEKKAFKDIESEKREKAATPEAKARAEADRQSILSGLERVKGMFK